ncbi:MAG: hypothetical protein JWN78_475 [Bacteroidota bacterium]|nr:hypothetical protein [Bacteroidota bacterium]
MSEDLLIPELFELPAKEFTEHFQLKGNDRIIFSGIYGIGKTTFIKHYFKEETQVKNFKKKRYNVVHLYPVNYSVATNEDIFKYIKFDILYELIENKIITLEKNDFSFLTTSKYYLWFHFPKFIMSLLSFLPKVGKEIDEGYKKFNDIQKDLIDFYRNANKGEADEISKFYDEHISQEGSIYEDGIITQLIRNKLSEIKVDGHENILIIDDLDRIDPHHIFRLFNVFAAHFDNDKYERKNKFGFDKVIFVCDIDNIRNIFKNNYGADVDFNGYIDKFYSKKIFNYDITPVLRNLITYRIWTNIKLKKTFEGHDIPIAAEVNTSLVSLLFKMIEYNQINLRELLKYYKQSSIELYNRIVYFPSSKEINNHELLGITLIDILIEVFGDKQKLIEVLENCYSVEKGLLGEDRFEIELTILLPLLLWEQHKFHIDYKKEIDYRNAELGFTIAFNFVGKKMGNWYYSGDIRKIITDNGEGFSHADLYMLYIKAVKILEQINYLK